MPRPKSMEKAIKEIFLLNPDGSPTRKTVRLLREIEKNLKVKFGIDLDELDRRVNEKVEKRLKDGKA